MHKRVSQLVELTAAEVAGGDWFYIIDVSSKEGKKIQTSQLGAYLNASGSFTVIQADTASYVLGSDVHGSVSSASFADSSLATISASYSDRSFSSSYSNTASFAMNSIAGSSTSSSWASASLSASWADRSGTSLNSVVASSLIYPNSSTASYAIKAQLVDTASYSKTASFIASSGVSVTSASYANRSGFSSTSDIANVSLELNYPNSSTASYAIIAENFVYNHYVDYGVFLAMTQSISASQLDCVEVSSSTGTIKQTNVSVMGTVIIPYTSSIAVDESLTLKIKSRDTGIETTLDSTPIYHDMSRTLNAFGSVLSGSLKVPFVLEGSSSLLGNYMVFVTGSSSKIQIEPTRVNRFNLSSLSDSLIVSSNEVLMFNLSSLFVPTMSFSSSLGGPFFDTLENMLISGSSNILAVNVSNQNITSIRYVWTLTNLTELNVRNNTISHLEGMPNTLSSLICDSCSISTISSLVNTTMSYFDCKRNNLNTLPDLPTSLSYLNCSNNSLTVLSGLPNTMSYLDASNNLIYSIPSTFPYGITNLYLNNNQLLSMTSVLPESLITMSVSNNSLLFWTSSFPMSLTILDVSYNPSLSSISTISPSLLYLDAVSCSFSAVEVDTICSQSVVNGLTNGTLKFNGNGAIMNNTVNNYILPLQGLGWIVGYDSSIP